MAGDILDLLGVQAVRGVRPVAAAALAGSYRALVTGDPGAGDPGTGDPGAGDSGAGAAVTTAERAVIALRVATVHRSSGLIAWFTEILDDLGGLPAEPARRLGVLPRFAATLAARPSAVQPGALHELRDAGLDDRGIVVVCQLTGFISYLTRIVAGLTATGTGAAPHVSLPPGFSMAARTWTSRLSQASTAGTGSEYTRTLAHDPASLEQRSLLYDETMYGTGGLDRADRELVALAVSLINGCPYCASVHARRLAQRTGDRDGVAALLGGDQGFIAGRRRAALVRAAAELTAIPAEFGAGALGDLRDAGLGDAEIFDVINVAAMFAWANRLMLVLGDSRPCGS